MRPTVRESTGALFMLRCAELGLSDEALDGMTMGMIRRSIRIRQLRMIFTRSLERGE